MQWWPLLELVIYAFFLASPGLAGSKSCDVDCTGKRKRPVCASDRRTYPSRCEVKRQRSCEGNKIRIVSKGECEDVDSSRKRDCVHTRNKAMAENQKRKPGSPPTHVYECRADGTFREVQCFGDYCWCVTEDGTHIASSGVQGRKPDCGNARRKPVGCSDSVSKEFHRNMYRAFLEEYERLDSWVIKQHESNLTEDSREKQVFLWKFGDLDRSEDFRLQASEIKNLKKAVKKAVEPRVCAKDFAKRCDTDSDGDLIEREWLACFGEDREPSPPPLIPENPFMVYNQNGRGVLPMGLNPPYVDDGAHQTPPAAADSTRSSGADIWGIQARISRLFQNISATSTKISSATSLSCRMVRAEALESKDGRMVPNCQADGTYNRTQCHAVVGVCWCVNERTGEFTKDPVQAKTLDCSHMPASPDLQPTTPNPKPAPVPGAWSCPFEYRNRFVTDLHNKALKQAKNHVSSSRYANMQKKSAGFRKSLTWAFGQIDTNNNKAVDSKAEKASFRNFIRGDETQVPKKCWRTFYKYCDRDEDGDVSLKEFLARATLNSLDDTDAWMISDEVNPMLLLLKSSNI